MPTNRVKGVPLMVICYIFTNHPYVRIYFGQPASSSPETILQACVLVKEIIYFKSRLMLYCTKLLEKLLIAQEGKKVSAWCGIRRIFPFYKQPATSHFLDQNHSKPEPPILLLWNFLILSSNLRRVLRNYSFPLGLATKILRAFPFTLIRAQSFVSLNFIILNEVISKVYKS